MFLSPNLYIIDSELRKVKFQVRYGSNKQMEIVIQYKNVLLDAFLKYNVTIDTLADQRGKALGIISNKYRILKGMGYKTQRKMNGTMEWLDSNIGKKYTKC